LKVKVLYFAALREQLGTSGEEFELPAGVSTLAALRAHLRGRGGAWQSALADGKLVAVNQDMAQPSAAIKAGDEVAFFPPVTGG
jgi:molybdopterin synthase sulfur carrier subunit